MKKNIILFLFLLISIVTFAQNQPPARTWYKNKTVHERWFEDENGQKHGKYISYDTDGSVIISASYNHGKLHGIYTEKTSMDGNGLTKTTFVNDVKNGAYSEYYRSTLISYGNYKNDLEDGLWHDEYDKKDKVYQEGYCVKGRREGKWINISCDEYSGYTTKKGYIVYFKNGQVVKAYDNLGNDLTQKKLEEDKKVDIEKKTKDFDESVVYETQKILSQKESELYQYVFSDGKRPIEDTSTTSLKNKLNSYLIQNPELSKRESFKICSENLNSLINDYSLLYYLMQNWFKAPDTLRVFDMSYFNPFFKQYQERRFCLPNRGDCADFKIDNINTKTLNSFMEQRNNWVHRQWNIGSDCYTYEYAYLIAKYPSLITDDCPSINSHYDIFKLNVEKMYNSQKDDTLKLCLRSINTYIDLNKNTNYSKYYNETFYRIFLTYKILLCCRLNDMKTASSLFNEQKTFIIPFSDYPITIESYLKRVDKNTFNQIKKYVKKMG